MSKKTSRAARTQQSVKVQEAKRDASARPLVATNGANAVNSFSISASDLADSSAKPVATPEKREPSSVSVTANNIVRPNPVRPAVNSVPRRFVNPQPRQTNIITREEEVKFIRADLYTVLVLAVLMVIVLIVLTIIIGH